MIYWNELLQLLVLGFVFVLFLFLFLFCVCLFLLLLLLVFFFIFYLFHPTGSAQHPYGCVTCIQQVTIFQKILVIQNVNAIFGFTVKNTFK